MKLATRLTVGLSTTSVVTLAACFFFGYAVVERNQLNDLDQNLRNEAHTTALLLEDDAESIAALTWPWRRARDIPSAGAPYVAVISPEGKVMTMSFNLVDRINQVKPAPPQLLKYVKSNAFDARIGDDGCAPSCCPSRGASESCSSPCRVVISTATWSTCVGSSPGCSPPEPSPRSSSALGLAVASRWTSRFSRG